MSEFEDTFEPEEAIPAEEAIEEQEATPQEPVEEQAEPVVEPAEKPAETVPASVVGKLRQEVRELKELNAQSVQQPQPEPVVIPDVIEDQNGFVGIMQNQIAQAAETAALNASEVIARETHGDEVVEAALQAALAAGVGQQFRGKKHAYGEMVKWHKQQRAAEEIGDPVAFKERMKAEILAEIQAENTAAEIKNPPSMANETSIGGRTAPPAPTHTALDDIL